MATLSYNGEVVDSVIQSLSSIMGEVEVLADIISVPNKKIVNALGFSEYVGGITDMTFSM